MAGSTQTRDYGRLKALLEDQETFPLQYTFKVIGKNTRDFGSGLAEFEAQFPNLVRQGKRESAEGAHISVTYSVLARDASEITWLYEQASEIRDVRILL
jgi:putative lipoic acid-binding regulatory protein